MEVPNRLLLMLKISGGVDPSVTGTDFFKDVEINLEGNNLTDDNFLTEEGLHWSDKTYTEIIQGKENGIINDPERLGLLIHPLHLL